MNQRHLLVVATAVMLTASAGAVSAQGLVGPVGTGFGLELDVDRRDTGLQLDGLGASYATGDQRFSAQINADGSLTARHETRGGLGWRTTVSDESQRVEIRLGGRF